MFKRRLSGALVVAMIGFQVLGFGGTAAFADETDEAPTKPAAELVYPEQNTVIDLADGSNLTLKVKALQGADIQVMESGKEVAAHGTGAGEDEVDLVIEKPAAGTHNYKVVVKADGYDGPAEIEVPEVKVHAFKGIQLDKDAVRLQVGEAHEVVISAVYGPINVPVSSSYVTLQAEDEDVIEINGNKVEALDVGDTVVTVTYGESAAKLRVKVSNVTDDVIDSVSISLPKTSISVGESVYAAVYADYWIGSELKSIEIKDGNILRANPSGVVRINGLEITGASGGNTVVTATYEDKSADVQLQVVASGGGSGGGIWYSPIIPPAVDDSEKQQVTREQLQLKDGMATIIFEKGKYELLIPVGAIDWLEGGTLEVVRDEATLRIPVSLFKEMLDSLKLTAEDTEYLTVLLKPGTNGSVQVGLSAITKKGESHAYLNYGQPIKLLFPLAEGKDARYLGIYSVSSTDSNTFVGGKRNGTMLEGNANRSGEYVLEEWNKQFADVPSTHWASAAIRTLNAKHIVNGVNDTQYRPNGLITRAEFTAIVVRAFELPIPASTGSFKDVSTSSWYADYVAAAAAANITNGISADRFAPNVTITREQMIVMLVRAANAASDSSSTNLNQRFKDENAISSWAYQAVSIGTSKGWIEGRPNGNFDPKGNTTRAESAMMLYNIFEAQFK